MQEFGKLEKNHPGIFIKKGNEARCVDCGAKGVLSLKAKNLCHNAAIHVESDNHSQRAKTVCASSSKKITSFFAPKAKTVPDNKADAKLQT